MASEESYSLSVQTRNLQRRLWECRRKNFIFQAELHRTMAVSVLKTIGGNESSMLNHTGWRSPSSRTMSPVNMQEDGILRYNEHELANRSSNNFQQYSPINREVEEYSRYSSSDHPDTPSSPQTRGTMQSDGSEDPGSTPHRFVASGGEISDVVSNASSPASCGVETIRTPKGSGSNGKTKAHRCRTCNYISAHKTEAWKHLEVHMKPDKILRCKECPFVTEYKHHLDFHEQNHKGDKPFKCVQCSYSCVNKSMLKSHLKSHSNFYQFSCGSCPYHTKYCHSLKIHLRKYKHKPGKVLDAEGNEDPNLIIDVYGNRRGPRQKTKKNSCTATTTKKTPAAAVTVPTTIASAAQSHPQLATPLTVQQATMPSIAPMPWIFSGGFVNQFLPEVTGLVPRPPQYAMEESVMAEPCLPGPDFDYINNKVKRLVSEAAGFPIALHSPNNNNNTNVNNLNYRGLIAAECSPFVSHEHNDNNNSSNNCNMNLENPINLSPQNDEDTDMLDTIKEERLSPVRQSAEANDEEMVPLNLCKTEAPPTTPSPFVINVLPAPSSSAPTSKSRRKGVVRRLHRGIVESATNPTMEIQEPILESPTSTVKIDEVSTRVEERLLISCVPGRSASDEVLSKLKNEKYYYCQYCEITFFNEAMYNIHMGYHGFSDPFTCNRCGLKTEDKVGFYTHLVSTAHPSRYGCPSH